jgi:Asp-tRNA(Asn)/Glu-tRNA(Gln) amidotransferase A subunit family amidase
MEILTMLSATQAAEAISCRQISSPELVEAVLRQIERHNPALNAIVTLDAMERAKGLKKQKKRSKKVRCGDPCMVCDYY